MDDGGSGNWQSNGSYIPSLDGKDDGGDGNHGSSRIRRCSSGNIIPSLAGMDYIRDVNQGSSGSRRCSSRICRHGNRIRIGRGWISGSGGLRVDVNDELYVLDSGEEGARWDAKYVPDLEPQVVDATNYYVPDSEDMDDGFFVPKTQDADVEVGNGVWVKQVKAATMEVEGSSFVPKTQLQDPIEVNVTTGVEDGPTVMEVDGVVMNVMDIPAADFYRTIREGGDYPLDIVLSMLEVLLPAYSECNQK